MNINKLKQNSKGFSHVEMIIALVVIVAIAGVGIFVYKHHQNSNKSMNSIGTTTSKGIIGKPVKGSSVMVNGKSLGSIVPKASAVNLSELDAGAYGVFPIYACKTVIPAYGAVQIQAYYWKPASYNYAAGYLYRYSTNGKSANTIKSQVSYTYLYNLVTSITYTFQYIGTHPNGNTGWTSFQEIANSNQLPVPGSSTIVSANTFNDTSLEADLVNC